jgi:uncharacterized protein (TIGR00369 family)
MSDATSRSPAEMTGLELIQNMVAGTAPPAAIGKLMAMRAGAAGEGWVEFIGTPGREHYNPVGSVHGGYAATLLDSCMACAVHTTLPAGVSYTTVDLNITYLRAMTDRTGDVTARGEIIISGRRIATARGTLTDSAGKIIATGTTTCLVLEPSR